MSQEELYQMIYYHHAKIGLAASFKRMAVKSRMVSNIWEYERTGFITPFSPRFYTKQVIALRRCDFETKQPTDTWDVIQKDSLWNNADVIKRETSEAGAERAIEEFNQEIRDHLEQTNQRDAKNRKYKRDQNARLDL